MFETTRVNHGELTAQTACGLDLHVSGAAATLKQVVPRTPRNSPVSTGFFVGSVSGGNVVGLLLAVVGASALASPSESIRSIAGVTIVAGLLSLIFAKIIFLALLYNAWRSIQDEATRTSAGKAVGFLFIPIFNRFWTFRAIPGFADEYNSYLDRAKIPAPRLTKGPLQCLAICELLSYRGVLGLGAFVAARIVQCVVAKKLCAAINAIGARDARPN